MTQNMKKLASRICIIEKCAGMDIIAASPMMTQPGSATSRIVIAMVDRGNQFEFVVWTQLLTRTSKTQEHEGFIDGDYCTDLQFAMIKFAHRVRIAADYAQSLYR